jgi:hypothetical protein
MKEKETDTKLLKLRFGMVMLLVETGEFGRCPLKGNKWFIP